MRFQVKQTTLNLRLAVYTVLFINGIVLAQNRSTEIKSGENQTNSFPMFLAKSIENATILADLTGLQTTKFEFLYLHGRSKHVEFDNEEVELKLRPFTDKQDYPYPIQFYPNKIPSQNEPLFRDEDYRNQNQSQPQTTNEYQTLTQFAANYQPKVLVENESTQSSYLRNIQGENLSRPFDQLSTTQDLAPTSWKSYSTYSEPSPQNQYDTLNNNTSLIQELSTPSSAFTPPEHNSSTEEDDLNTTTQYNTSPQADDNQDYQQQQQSPENTTPQQNSFEQTMNQNTAQTNAAQQQNYYSSIYQQQESEGNTTTSEDPRFSFEQSLEGQQYTNDEQEQNIQPQQQTLQDVAEKQQKSFNESILRDQQLQQYSAEKLTTPEPMIQSTGDDKFIQASDSEQPTEESNLENTTNYREHEQERPSNQTGKYSSITDEQFQNQLPFPEEQNKQKVPQESATNLKDTEQNLFQIEKDPNIVQSLLSDDLSQLRNEYELNVQQKNATTTDAIEPDSQTEDQKTYNRQRREDETNKYLFKKTNDVHNNVKSILGKQLQKLLEEKKRVETKEKDFNTNQVMMNKPRTGVQDKPHSKANIFDRLVNNPSNTNFLLLSSPSDHKHTNVTPEHDLLVKLEAMRYNFLETYDECPSFVIFGTSSESCYTLTLDKNNCAEEFIEVTEVFKQSCSQTQFYIYAREVEKVNEDNVKNLNKNGINVLIH